MVASASEVEAQMVMGYRIEYPAQASLPEAGEFSNRLADVLQGWHAVHVDMDPPEFEVLVGDFQDRGQAASVLRALRAKGIRGGKVVRTRVRVPFEHEGNTAVPAESSSRAPSLQLPAPHVGVVGPVAPASSRRAVAHSRPHPPARVEILPYAPPVAGSPFSDGGTEFRATPAMLTERVTALPPPDERANAGPISAPPSSDEQAAADPTSASPPSDELAAVDPTSAPPSLHERAAEPPAAATMAGAVEADDPAVATRGSVPKPLPDAITYRGVHGAATCSVTHGWAWNPQDLTERVAVEFYDGDRLLGTVLADRLRQDMASAGRGDGRYGFRFRFPEDMAPPQQVEARVAGTSIVLRGSPKVTLCATADGAPDANLGGPVTKNGAEAGNAEGAEAPPKSAWAKAVPNQAVVVDGRLDEDLWDEARFLSDFQQKGLNRGFPRPPWTRVAFAYDDEALYVAARMEGPGSESVDTKVAVRDEPGNGDRLLISLDTYGDKRTAYTFGVTAGGVRVDHYHPEDDEILRDQRFDPVWEARTVADSAGWTAEMRIPFSQLRFAEGEDQTWGLNIRRWDPQRFMNLYWVVVPMEERGWASRFGRLDGIANIAPSRRIEIAPYLLRGLTEPVGLDADAAVEGESTLRFGGDVKVGLGPDLTLDATVLPDFGQVDADPADVNLTAFETTFEERRPFFTEGATLFRGRGPRYFYSRRIGAIPFGTDPGNAVDLPVNSDILSAVKLTGRLDSGTSVAGLLAVTPSETAVTTDEFGAAGSAVIAPATTYLVGRAERELGRPGSVVGFTVTGLHRNLEPGTIPETVLSRQAVAGGGDWSVRFDEGVYELAGFAGFSMLAGDERAVASIQRNSVHYFQRPDADHVEYDPTRTSLGGYTGGLTLSKVAGTRWTWSVGGGMESPGFNIRDAGILRSADHRDAFASVGFRSTKPNPVFRHYRITAVTNASWNFGGVRRYLASGFVLNGAFTNFLRPYVSLMYEAPSLSDELTRGGPLMGTPAAVDLGLGLSSPFGSRSQWSLNGNYRTDEFGGWFHSVNAGVSVRAGSHVEFSLYPGYSRSLDTRQYYGSLPGGDSATFGRREIFSELSRSEIYAQARVDVSLTPDVSFQLYVEPFASSGDYSSYGELAEAGGSEVRRYGEEGSTIEPGEYGSLEVVSGTEAFSIWPTPFNIRSFRSNALVRWEWRRGSSLFLIWQQNRWGYESQGASVQGGALFDSLRDSGENIFMLKLDYRLGIR